MLFFAGFTSKVALPLTEKRRQSPGSADLKAQLKYQSDMGVELVENGGGYVFAMQNYQEAKDKKKFVGVIALAMADVAQRTHVEATCVCEMQRGLDAWPQCQATKVKLASPVSFFCCLF